MMNDAYPRYFRLSPSHAERQLTTLLKRTGILIVTIAVMLAPYVEWRPADIFITTSDALFIVGGCLLLGSGSFQMRPFGGATSSWLLSFIMMMTGLFVGSIFNGEPVRWLIATVQYGFGFVLLPFIMAGDNDGRELLFAKALLTGVVLMELFGAAVYYGYPATYEEYQKICANFITGGRRLGAFVGQPNWNAAVISMAFPFAFYLRAKRHLSAFVAYGGGAALGVGLMLSASFTGFVSTLVVLLVFLLVGGTRKTFRAGIVLSAAVTVLLVSGYQLPAVFQGRVGAAIETGDMTMAGTYSGRMDLIREAWEIVDETTIVGLGVDQYRAVSADQAPVHNMYLLLWAEGGVIALLGWLLLLAIALISVVRVYRVDRQAAALGLSVIATFVIFSTASPHMYARVWLVPLVLALAIVFESLRGASRPYQSGYL